MLTHVRDVTTVSATGGASVDWLRVSWPFARLEAATDRLALSIGVLRTSYAFSPEEVVALEPHGEIPAVGSGVRIVHNRSDYPADIAFYVLGSRGKLLQRIGGTGFRPRGTARPRIEREPNPFRWGFLMAVLGLWSALFLLDGATPWRRYQPGPLTVLALALAFVVATALTHSERLQEWALKPGRHLEEVLPILRLAQLVSLFLLGVLAISRAW
jgi:hypothetical protein